MDDADLTIRQYVAALLPTQFGFFKEESMLKKWQVRRLSRRIKVNLTASKAILQVFISTFWFFISCQKTI